MKYATFKARTLITTLFIANYLANTGAIATSYAQNVAKPAASTCPTPQQITPLHWYGLWRAEFSDGGPGATLLMEKHPELAGSFAGQVNRNGAITQLAGDVDNGSVTLEESTDGKQISAVWQGQVVATSCGKEVTGVWTLTTPPQSRRFVLRKLPGWL